MMVILITISMHYFERQLLVPSTDSELDLQFLEDCPWLDFLLNPRRLRGSDFLMRWSQGEWSESRIVDAVNDTREFYALPYGPSSTAPDDDVRAYELYFERLEKAGLKDMKRPDILVFPKKKQHDISEIIAQLGGLEELPFTSEDDERIKTLLSKAIIAVESENSLWKAGQMPNYKDELRPMRRLGGKPGLPKGAVLPTITIKEEDRVPLRTWQEQRGVKIHVWQVFYDLAFGISLDRSDEVIREGLIQAREQTYQAPGGATTKKAIYFIYHHYAYELGSVLQEPTLRAKSLIDKNGHVLPFVVFEGGKMQLQNEAIGVLQRNAHG